LLLPDYKLYVWQELFSLQLMKTLLISILICLIQVCSVAQRYDYNWILSIEPDSKGIQLSFDTFPPRLEQLGFRLIQSLTSLSDSVSGAPMLSASPSKAYGLGVYAPQIIDSLAHYYTYEPGQSYFVNTISLALPQIGVPNQFNIYNTDEKENIVTGLNYNQISMMRLRFDSTDITILEKNTAVWQEGIDLRLQAVKHANGRDYWVFVPGFNNSPDGISNGMYVHAFLFDSTGLHYQGKQSFAGDFGVLTYQFIGSPDGKYLVMSAQTSTGLAFPNNVHGDLVLFEVDRCVGQLQLVHQQSIFDFRVGFPGAAFSSDNKLLYFTDYYHILQQDLTVLPQVEIDTVFKLQFDPNDPMSYGPRAHGQMRLGPDGRIYIRQYKTLGIIEKPNIKGAGCTYRAKAVKADCHTYCMVPSHPEYRLGPIDGSPCDTLGLDNCVLGNFHWYSADSSLTVEFIDNSTYEPQSWLWSFGDGSVMVSDINPVHTFPSAGIYEVCMVVTNACRSDTICQKVEVFGLSDTEEPTHALGNMRLSPNPASGMVDIRYQLTAKPEYLEVYNLQGQLMYQTAVTGLDSGYLYLDASAYPAGMYAVCLRTRGGSVEEKLVVVR
jgi:hypothetical protein